VFSLGLGIGLGFSGYTIVELFGAIIIDKLRALFGSVPDSPEEP
jgi:hypothetical protein